MPKVSVQMPVHNAGLLFHSIIGMWRRPQEGSA